MDGSVDWELFYAREELSSLRLKYNIEELGSSPYWDQNFLKLLELINEADKKLESAYYSNFIVTEVIETTEMEEETDNEELVEEDSTNSELVTDFSRNLSIPLEEEEDDSLNLEFIQSVFFDGNEDSVDVDLEEGKPIPYFSHLMDNMGSQFEIVASKRVRSFDNLNPDTSFEGYYEHSKDLITHLKLNCKNNPYLHLDFTRSIFDRGKWFDGSVLNNDYKGDFVYELSLKDGYRFNWFFMDSITFVLVKNGDIADTGNLFVKMLLWDIMYFKNKGVSSHQLASEKSSYPCFNLTGGVFDRGKDIELTGREGKGRDTCKLFDPGIHNFRVNEGFMIFLLGISDCEGPLWLNGSSKGMEIIKGCPDDVEGEFILQLQLGV
ncbi:uncharacterized protein LOC113358038 [Papaver somniferum]|uniref:uncharacterized protein LOC113358038 n=1 Tax=Papaver somniferum TaxID=3469 RepID=UPI000E6FB939|nr:uncharacterized protein LOC113358038 [Papaver somniferum]